MNPPNKAEEMNKFKEGDRVRFKNTRSEECGFIIGFFEDDELNRKGELLASKGECKVKMDSTKEGGYTSASASPNELELAS